MLAFEIKWIYEWQKKMGALPKVFSRNVYDMLEIVWKIFFIVLNSQCDSRQFTYDVESDEKLTNKIEIYKCNGINFEFIKNVFCRRKTVMVGYCWLFLIKKSEEPFNFCTKFRFILNWVEDFEIAGCNKRGVLYIFVWALSIEPAESLT